jgi:transcriptional regulator with XRE-family HTH domain
MNIGEAIVILRKRKGVKQKEMAAEIGISASHLSLVENNEQKPSVDLIAKIASYFDLPVSSIVYMAMRDNFDNEEQQKYFEAAKPFIEKLMNYLLSDSSTAKGKEPMAAIKQKLKKRNTAQ